jgi:hypothetical protein
VSLVLIPVKVRATRADGTFVVGATVRAVLTVAETDDGLVVPGNIVGVTNGAGECTLNLWPNSRGVNGSQYRVEVSGASLYFSGLVTVPEAPNTAWPIALSTLINQPPYPSRTAAETAQLKAQEFMLETKGYRDESVPASAQAVAARNEAVPAAATATVARIAAEAARDSINSTGKVFTSTALGIVGTVNGQSFSVLDAGLLFWIVYKNNGGVALELGRSYTKAYLDQVADLTADRYFLGKKVLFCRADAGGRGGDVITEDGYLYAKFALRGLNGIAVAQAIDGFWELAFTGAVDDLAFSGGMALGGTTDFYYDGKKVVRGWGDLSNRASVVETEDGMVYIPKLSSPSLDLAGVTAPLEVEDYVFSVANIGGKQQLFRTGKTSGVRSQATALGNNSAPRLSSDGSKVVYSTDRNVSREGFFQLLAGTKHGGAVEHPVLPRTTIMPLGDSLTAADYASTVAATLGTALLVPSTDAAAGIGSQNSTQIAARYGALALTCSLAGDTMNAGPSPLTAISAHLISRVADAAGTVRTLRAAILGVSGTLTSTQSPTVVSGALVYAGQWYTYTFTPDVGQALPGAVPAGSALVIDPEARQDSTLLCWVGRNDVGGAAGWQVTLKANIAAIFAAYKPLVRHIGLLSITNSTGEPSGSANYNDIVALNAELAALYPDSFVDVRTAYNAGTATDIPAAANTSDGIHYTAAGKAVIAGAVATFITTKGWYTA